MGRNNSAQTEKFPVFQSAHNPSWGEITEPFFSVRSHVGIS
ncbi:Uncharacterized protein dnm_042650 [Desulfonema magnum]|uniref:Uncharacterized protein n=1 Tax=Desulfonema magnum TaxID=45655 RepID=A0A975BMH9_9BACT|nr:Uncharacterized protein dnm_042650 [Desulfonema magnum]